MEDLPFPHLKEKVLAEVSTFGIGGPARYFAEADTIENMATILRYCFEHNLSFFILGKGSNTLFDDRGFNGLVIANKIDTFRQLETEFFVGAGYGFARLGGLTARLGFSGLEFAAGIPATVGGAVFMNAGANGSETCQTLQKVVFVEADGTINTYEKKHLHFGYRTSSFHHMKGAIVEGHFLLTPSESAKATQKKIVDYRLKTQPYKDKSAGCAFRNPAGDVAGRLIEQCGLKGAMIGGAQISTLHANFIVNAEGAKAQDVRALIDHVKEKIYQQKGVVLEEEIRYVPYSI